MIVYHSFEDIVCNRNTVLTIGTFDGVHRGHQSIVNTLLEKAKELHARTFLITFDPHPQIVLQKPNREPIKLLTSIQERLFLLQELGIENVLVIPFTKEFAQIDAEEFVREYIVKKIGVCHIFIGYDHMFGKNREGNEHLLTTLGDELDFTVDQIPAFSVDKEVISSTKIRRALKDHQIEQANTMLGYPYIVMGKVMRGDGRGRKLGIPTANIEPTTIHKLLPANGVYFVSSLIDGQTVYGMANIGTRPTFTDDVHPTLEVHFFDWDRMLYDRELIISFLKFIREERKFASLDLFLSQIFEDRMICQELAEHKETKNK